MVGHEAILNKCVRTHVYATCLATVNAQSWNDQAIRDGERRPCQTGANSTPVKGLQHPYSGFSAPGHFRSPLSIWSRTSLQQRLRGAMLAPGFVGARDSSRRIAEPEVGVSQARTNCRPPGQQTDGTGVRRAGAVNQNDLIDRIS